MTKEFFVKSVSLVGTNTSAPLMRKLKRSSCHGNHTAVLDRDLFIKIRCRPDVFSNAELNGARNNQEQILMDKIVSHHSGSDFGQLCKSTNRLNGTHSLPVSVDGVIGELDIANILREHFTVKSPLWLSQMEDLDES